jgi:predicted nicotinamide N-methyase
MKTDSIPLVERALRSLTEALRATLPMGRIDAQPLPGCPDIRLGLISADFPTGPLPPEVMNAVISRPAYWALCWGSGLGLAQLLYRHPQWVRGRRVLDFGSGSGVVGIAAMRNGAAAVVACDSDPAAREATRANAVINDVRIDVCSDLADAGTDFDLVLMADVLYERGNLPLLDALQRIGRAVVVADSRVTEIPRPGYRLIAQLDARTHPNLNEFDEFRTVRIFAHSFESTSGVSLGAPASS